MRRPFAALVAAPVTVACLLALSGCGGAAGGEDGASSEPVVVDISVEGGEISPSGERVEVGVDQPIDLVVTADEPGEIHVHSTPEQTFPYEAGDTTIKMQIDRAGVVEVESHEPEQIIVQLEVS